MINTVTGEFTSYRAEVVSDASDWSEATFTFETDINSINTRIEMRDGHLKSDKFFGAENFPTMNFVSIRFDSKGDGAFELVGNLTIRDVTKEVVLDVVYGGQMVDFYGNTKAGFEISGAINRKEFGLTWDAVTEAGGIVVSDTVKLAMNLQLQKQ